MFSPRWQKVLRDVWSNKTRMILVVLSIAVGVFAVGLIAGSRVILLRDMTTSIRAAHTAAASLYIGQFDADLVQTVRRMPGVGEADGRASPTVRVSVGPDEWKNIQLTAIADYHDLRLDLLEPVSGAWPPGNKEVLLERGSLNFLKTQVGQTILIELPDGKRRDMRVAGVVHDVNLPSPQLAPFAFGFITLDTLEWLGQPRAFNELRISVAENPYDEAHVKQVVEQVRDKLEKGGYTVYGLNIRQPNKHWADDITQSLLLILGVLGFFSLLLSGFLVVNTIGALLMQQTRQIGVMKAVGARRIQIMGIYLALVLIFGLLAIAVALPLGALASGRLIMFLAALLNFNVTSFAVPHSVLALEVAAGLGVPLLAALWPIMLGTRISVRQAISEQGLGQGRYGTHWLDRVMGHIPSSSRPLLLSLRNTFRRRTRLALTLSTLTLGGAMLIAVLSVQTSLLRTLDDLYTTYSHDMFVFMDRSYRIPMLESAARQVPGVVGVESWSSASSRRVRADGTKTDSINVSAPPADTQLFRPNIIAGRWLLPDDENAVVVPTDLLNDETDLEVGDNIVLDIRGHETTWRVVGIAQVLFARRTVYANHAYVQRVTNSVGRSGMLVVVTQRHDPTYQQQVAKDLRDHFKRAGLNVSGTYTMGEDRTNAEFQFNIIVVFLLSMAVLLGIVGGLGLMGTMSINVLERTREIGVMRAIGASNGAILRIVLIEGLLIGVFSWVLGSLVAIPMSLLLSNAVGQSMLHAPLSYRFATTGALLWLGLVLILAALASFLPAWKASRVTVRDVLAYE